MPFTFTRLRRAILSAPMLAVLAAPATALAQASYPNKPIQVIVPLQAGSAADVGTRVVLGKVGENMGASFAIENQPGASGLVGADRIARAAPDGYTLGGITDSVLNYAVNLAARTSFDPLNDFEPVSRMANIAWVLVANNNAAKTVNELVAQAQAQPRKLDYASGGNGSPHHIAMELFSAANKVQLTHVPYKGATQATTDVAGGQVPVMFSAVSVALPMIKDGKLRALAQPADRRSSLLPDVPTFTEVGMPAFNFSTWLGLYAPKGTPKAIIDRLNAEVARALTDPGVRDRLMGLGLDPLGSTPAQLGELTRTGHARIGKVIRDAGIKAE
ncbi:Bug family tripartite tricarboxylate transporter substrate binding protein [Hydrogenophaga laconesensis]|uniref:Tripartite-type tricarboxylate transporter receptor subunit TctC n=1 Tax=Hydrogenophaga laconesensis TaxID=1805971 RepID=A0ABU1VHL4_9BURK|nr:tripartite tricarboxylate transporter substrate binding protein [Hydrogenophaga laconesensis]MDR7096976.1 tripartite-type tricarboxylate transporter receptor subunit TctC [Hydrogenophaga laconesensis]